MVRCSFFLVAKRSRNGQLGLGKTVQKQLLPRPVSILEEGTVVSKIACGTSHTVALTAGKVVFSWGGEGGDAGLRQVNFPNGVTIKSLSAGNGFTLAIANDGQLYSWGNGLDGRLGVGSTRNYRNPQKVVFPSNNGSEAKVKRVSAGKAHGLALTDSGHVYSWGCNTKGQLGLGIEEDSPAPALVPELQGVVRIATGESHSLALTDAGVVYAWGNGESGQLGLEDVKLQNVPAVVSTLPEGVKAVRIAAGQFHSLAISEFGDVFAWGDNSFGQLGTGNLVSSSSAVYLETLPDNAFAAKLVGGEKHTLVLVTDFNRFEKSNVGRYSACLLPPKQTPSNAIVSPANSPATGSKRKSVRRSVKFNLDAAFGELEDDLLAFEGEEEEEEVVGEQTPVSTPSPEAKKKILIEHEVTPKHENDAMLGKNSNKGGCCIIL